MKTFIIILFAIVAVLFILAMGKPINEWFDKHVFNKDANNIKVKEKVNEIESNLKLKYPNLKEKGDKE